MSVRAVGRVLPIGPVVGVTVCNVGHWQDILLQEEEAGGLVAPQPIEGTALVDTGAGVSMIRPDVADALRACPAPAMLVKGLHPSTPWSTVPREAVSACYVRVVFPEIPFGTAVTAARLPFADAERGGDLLMLLGRDVLRMLSMRWDGPNGAFTLALPDNP